MFLKKKGIDIEWSFSSYASLTMLRFHIIVLIEFWRS